MNAFTCYPALDVRGGAVVRLHQGDYDRQTSYAVDPVEQARAYAAAGARWLHLVDLDGARAGGWSLAPLVRRIVEETGLSVQTGGGVRGEADVEAVLASGASRAVVGSMAVTAPEEVARWLRRWGPERLTLALDARPVEDLSEAPATPGAGGVRWELPTRGWTRDSRVDLADLLARYRREGLRHVLATDISRDGTMTGPGLALYDHLTALAPDVAVQASGGVRSAADVAAVRGRGCAGVVLGRSLLEGALDLADALAAGQRAAAPAAATAAVGAGAAAASPAPAPTRLARRVVPCLDVRDGRVVKGVRFADHRDVGGIEELARRYRHAGADEIVFYDISASPAGRSVDRSWVTRVARILDVPFSVAGGIRSVDDAREVLHAGADKVSVNTPALERPGLVDELADAFGVQCVVVGVDSLRDEDGAWRVRSHTGDPSTLRSAGRSTLEWVQEVTERGAGEVVLNCMGSDGVRSGYDVEQLAAVRQLCPVPLVASGGAGAVEHFVEAVQRADVDAVLAASVFHSGTLTIGQVQDGLATAGVEVRR